MRFLALVLVCAVLGAAYGLSVVELHALVQWVDTIRIGG